MTTEYYYANLQYKDVKLYLLDNKWTVERKSEKDTYRMTFNSLEIAQNYLENKQYMLYRILTY